MQRAVTLLLLLVAGCSSPQQKPADASSSPSSPLVGEWIATDLEVGVLRLRISGDDELECVLTDVRGSRYTFDGEPDGEGRLEVDLEPEARGLQILICRPETSLEVAGSMNYAKGAVRLTLSPARREGQAVVFLQVHRPDRKADTLRSVNLLREDPPAAESR